MEQAIRSETLIAIFSDILDSVKRHGIAKLTIVSGHGGNWFLKMMVRELNYRHADLHGSMVLSRAFADWGGQRPAASGPRRLGIGGHSS